MAKKLNKSKSNFTLRRLHQSGNYGNIYERDILTISGGGFSPEEQIPIYNSPTFKLSVRAGYNGRKIYNHSDWLINDYCSSSTAWTIGCIPKPNKDDSKVIIKPNKTKLTDFICYSSASELIRASIDDIIYKFPGELYITKNMVSPGLSIFEDGMLSDSDLFKIISNGEYFLVKNPLKIDVTQPSILYGDSNVPYKFFCASYKDYNIIDETNNVYSVIKWEVSGVPNNDDKECLDNGKYLGDILLTGVNNDENNKSNSVEIKLLAFYYENEMLLLCDGKYDYHIRPNNQIIDDYFDNLDDFQKIILNRNTNYCAKFETYIEDDEIGWYISEKDYKWPLSDGDWNISVDGVDFNNYIKSLSDLALGYDENFTDAIWRTMTHSAISNMDLTLIQNENETFINNSKVKKVLNIIGRQFDDIKSFIDSIKNCNKITYTQDNNLPDYFLSDNLELSGWETQSLFNNISESIITEPMYGSRVSGFTASDANNEFLRRLKLNSKDILSKKGTKQGIEDLLSLFGFHSIEWLKSYYNVIPIESELYAKSYEIKEYVNVIETPYITNSDTITDIKTLNSQKNNYDDSGESGEMVNPYQGLVITDVVIDDDNYIIPWFDKNINYDGDIYFQMKGGWMKDGKISNTNYAEYEHTVSNIFSFETIDDLYPGIRKIGYYYYVQNEDKCYVCNDDLTLGIYPQKNTLVCNELPMIEQIGYKYILCNEEYYYWVNIPTEIDSINILELTNEEQLNDKYDDYHYVKFNGNYYEWNEKEKKYTQYAKYIKYIGVPSNAYIESGRLNDLKKKFTNINKGNNPHTGIYDDGSTYLAPYRNWFINSSFNTEIDNIDKYGFNVSFKEDKNSKCTVVNDNNLLESLYTLNSKFIKINFDEHYETFIRENILPYLKQMIPSTTIIEYDFIPLNVSQKIVFQIDGKQDDTDTYLFEIKPPFEEVENTFIITREDIPGEMITTYLKVGDDVYKWVEKYKRFDDITILDDDIIIEVNTVPNDKYYIPSDANSNNTLFRSHYLPNKQEFIDTDKTIPYEYVKLKDMYYVWDNDNAQYVRANNKLITPSYLLCKDRYYKWCGEYNLIDCIEVPKDDITILSGYELPNNEIEGYKYIIFNGEYYQWNENLGVYEVLQEAPTDSII